MEKLILKKIAILNQISQHVIRDENNSSVIKKFTEESIKILDADFGYAFGKLNINNKFVLVYKNPLTPFNPVIPAPKKRNHGIDKKGNIIFDSSVKSKNYESDIVDLLKSYIIIPIRYGEHTFGIIVLCYKNQHFFTEEELILAEIIENILSRAMNINWLIEKEQKSLILAEKQKETEVLLSQEKLKTEFIGNATHELRTPLAIMKGNVDLALMDKKISKSARQTFKEINVEIKILSDILKDLALLISFDSANQNVKNIINPVRVNVAKLIVNLMKRLKTVAEEKKIKIKFKNEKTEDAFVSGNEKYLEKLFVNIIKNAITYGKNNGNIVIDLHKDKKNVKVKISDNGIGISTEDLLKIFDRFYRGDKAHTHGTYENNSGLGLAIAKWATEIHGGTIQAESIHGKSSTFTVTLPRLF